MKAEASIVGQVEAQRLFDALPEPLQMPSLSPAYVAADARRDPLLSPRYLVWTRGRARLIHAVQEARIPGRDGSDWQSAYGYGGPVATGLDASDLEPAWEALDALAREQRIVAEFVRFHPLLRNERHYPGTVRPDRPVVTLDLGRPDLLGRYGGRARTAIRKALADGLELRWETRGDALATFPAFYREGMRKIGASDFYLFNDEYFTALFGMREARVLSVSHDGIALAMGVFLFGREVAEYHLSASSLEGRRSNATNLMLHGAAEAAQEAGLRSFYLGGGTTPDSDNPLLRFKLSFAPATATFCTGSRIHDPVAYAALQAELPELARASRRVLFYRR